MNIYSIYGVVFQFTRRRRMRRFEKIVKPIDGMTVIDVGGNTYNWKFVDGGVRVHLVNVMEQEEGASLPQRFTQEVGDGCCLGHDDQSFDVAFSNSVIEHVGDLERQRQFAQEMRRVGRKLWVQTPARWTLIEPHYISFLVHWLPKPWRKRFLRYTSVRGLLNPKDLPAMIDEIRLLSGSEMRALFPDCQILTERFCFFPRSYIAVRNS